MKEKILFVDDDTNILTTFTRALGGQYALATCSNPEEGLRRLNEEGPFAVVVSDYKMPRMNGVKFLSLVGEQSPDTVRIMLTGYADLDASILAVNEGRVFRFLTKPCPLPTMTGALDAALKQYRLVMAERELLRGTLRGSVKLLTDVLSLVNPGAFGRAERIKKYATGMATRLKIGDLWKLDLAAMLSQISCIAIPDEIMDKKFSGRELSPEEAQIDEMGQTIAVSLVKNIPRMGEIADLIETSAKPGLTFEDEPVLSHILRVATDYFVRTGSGVEGKEALADMRAESRYDQEVIVALEQTVLEEEGFQTRAVKYADMRVGMVLAEDLHSADNLILLAAGREVTDVRLIQLNRIIKNLGVREPILVREPRSQPA